MNEYILLFSTIFAIVALKFTWNWIKVKIYLLSFNRNDLSSFMMTITYILSKQDIESMIKNKGL